MTPTVLLHGFLGAPASWDAVMRELPAPGESVALALPGHGPSPWIPGVEATAAIAAGARSLRGRASCSTFEEAIDAFAARLPARAHFVGYSMGARVALGILARHPHRVASLVAIGLDPGLEDQAARRARRAWDEDLARALESTELSAFVDAWEALPLFESQRALPAAVRASRRAARLDHVPPALAWAVRRLGLGAMPPLGRALADAAVPIHLVTGARDEKFTALARAAVARAPLHLHTVVGGVGHDVGLEAPRALARIVRVIQQAPPSASAATGA